ncbi:MAG: hypothetical protein QW728_02840, partial [Thermoplasmata archaeon]
FTVEPETPKDIDIITVSVKFNSNATYPATSVKMSVCLETTCFLPKTMTRNGALWTCTLEPFDKSKENRTLHFSFNVTQEGGRTKEFTGYHIALTGTLEDNTAPDNNGDNSSDKTPALFGILIPAAITTITVSLLLYRRKSLY